MHLSICQDICRVTLSVLSEGNFQLGLFPCQTFQGSFQWD